MGRGERRPFGVLDLMILISSVSVGCATLRAATPEDLEGEISWRLAAVVEEPNPGAICQLAVVAWFCVGESFVAPGAFAVTVLRLRRPRPPIRRAAQDPGVMVCCWIALVFATAFASIVVAWLILRAYLGWAAELPDVFRDILFRGLVVGYLVSSIIILTSWGIVAFRTRHPRGRGWIEGLALWLAGAWLVNLLPPSVVSILAVVRR